MGFVDNVGGFFKDAGDGIAHAAGNGYKAASDAWNTAVEDAKASANVVGTSVRDADAKKEQIGSWIDSKEQELEHKVDEGRAWLRQNGGVAGQVASDQIGLVEGVGTSLYGAGKGLVQLADGVQIRSSGWPIQARTSRVSNPGSRPSRRWARSRIWPSLQAGSPIRKAMRSWRARCGILPPRASTTTRPSLSATPPGPSACSSFREGSGAAVAGDAGRAAAVLNDVGKVAEVAKLAEVGKVAEAAKVAEVAKVANAADAANAAGRLGGLAEDAGAAGRVVARGEDVAASTIARGEPLQRAGGAGSGRMVGEPFPENPFPQVQQREANWCGAACGEMSAGRLGVEVDQATLTASSHFEPRTVVGQAVFEGGFQTKGLEAALTDVAPVPGREWRGGTIAQDISKPADLRTHLKGYIDNTGASVILRVEGGDHWIIVDAVLQDGRIAIRDPRNAVSTVVTPEQLSDMVPTGDAVFSFQKR